MRLTSDIASIESLSQLLDINSMQFTEGTEQACARSSFDLKSETASTHDAMSKLI